MKELSDKVVNEIIKLYEEGKTSSEIVDILNKKYNEVYRRDKQIIELYQTGIYSQSELAEMFGTTRSNVSRIINKSESKKN